MRITSSIMTIVATAAMVASPLVFAMQPQSSAQITPRSNAGSSSQRSDSPGSYGAMNRKKSNASPGWMPSSKNNTGLNSTGSSKETSQGSGYAWNSKGSSDNSGPKVPQ